MSIMIGQGVSLVLLATGLSLVLQARLWATLINALLDDPEKAVRMALLLLPWGLLVVLGHGHWRADASAIVTAFGWALTVKCLVLLWTSEWRKLLVSLSPLTLARVLRMGGMVWTGLGALAAYHYLVA